MIVIQDPLLMVASVRVANLMSRSRSVRIQFIGLFGFLSIPSQSRTNMLGHLVKPN